MKLNHNIKRSHYLSKLKEKISENLSQDQKRVATEGVPLKNNTYPNDVIGKVYEAHSSRVRGSGVCPMSVF